jgi:hypothetical protein
MPQGDRQVHVPMTTATKTPMAAAQMTEQELLDNVIELGHLFGWRIAHFRPAMTKHGWRTAVSADGAGWPDLTLVRGDRIIFVELKSAKGRLSDEQQIWLDALMHVGKVCCWRPVDWLDGTIELTLRTDTK